MLNWLLILLIVAIVIIVIILLVMLFSNKSESFYKTNNVKSSNAKDYLTKYVNQWISSVKSIYKKD